MSNTTKTIKIQAYQTPDGKPTCSADFPSGQFCQFLMTRKFGMEHVCGVANERLERYFDANLGEHGEYTYLKPAKACPLWSEE